jgi:hypothetical protein
MHTTTPRFEFRAFAQTFGRVAERVRERAHAPTVAESTERYLVPLGIVDCNVKIRGGRLEIKTLIERRDRLERWAPAAAVPFPLTSRFVVVTLLPALGLAPLDVGPDRIEENGLLDALRWPQRELLVCVVFKRRFRFSICGCGVELDELLVNGGAIRSVAVESADPGALDAALFELGLTDYENVNYPRAARRLTGLEPWPCAPGEGGGEHRTRAGSLGPDAR